MAHLIPTLKVFHDVTVVDWILDILGACEHISKEPVVLVGHSLGAGLCTMIAGLMPDRIRGLVLLDGLVPIPATEDSFCERFRNYVEARKKMKERKGPRLFADIESVVQARVNAGDVTPELAKGIVARNVSMHKGQYFWATDPRLKMPTVHRLTAGQIESVITQIECPVTLFQAESRDISFDETMFERYLPLIKKHRRACC